MRAFPKLELRGFLINESDLMLHRGGTYEHGIKRKNAWNRIEWLADLRYKYHFTPQLSLEGQLDFLYDAAWDWQNSMRHLTIGNMRFDTENAERELEYYHSFKRIFREAYIRWSLGNWELRLGKQQVVWGKAADITTSALDRVYSLDNREIFEFVPDDVEYRRNPTWMVNINYLFPPNDLLGTVDLQLLWIPDYEQNNDVPFGYPRSFLSFFPIPSVINLQKTDKPSAALKNHEWGTRLRILTPGQYDIQLYYLYYWNRMPTFFIKGLDLSALAAGQPGIFLERKPTRLHMLGLSLEKAYTITTNNTWVVRAEFAYTLKDYVSVMNENSFAALMAGEDGVKKFNHLQSIFNAETSFHPLNLIPGLYNFWGKHVGSPGPADWMFTQWFLTEIAFKYDSNVTGYNFWDIGAGTHRIGWVSMTAISKFFGAGDRASIGLAYAITSERGGEVYLASLGYEISDALKVSAKAVLLSGSGQNDVFGWEAQLDDHIEIGFEYNF